MKAGTAVRFRAPVLTGTVRERRINPATDELEVLVEWITPDGETHQRWFDADSVEPVEDAA